MNAHTKSQPERIECRIYGGYYTLTVRSWNTADRTVTVEGVNDKTKDITLPVRTKGDRCDSCALVDIDDPRIEYMEIHRDGQGNRFAWADLRNCRRIEHRGHDQYVTSCQSVYVPVPR